MIIYETIYTLHIHVIMYVGVYFLSFSRWKKIFNFRLFSSLQAFWKTSFYASLLIIIVLFVGKFNVSSINNHSVPTTPTYHAF